MMAMECLLVRSEPVAYPFRFYPIQGNAQREYLQRRTQCRSGVVLFSLN